MYIPPTYIYIIYTHQCLTHAICLDAPENITGVRSTTMKAKKLSQQSLYIMYMQFVRLS